MEKGLKWCISLFANTFSLLSVIHFTLAKVHILHIFTLLPVVHILRILQIFTLLTKLFILRLASLAKHSLATLAESVSVRKTWEIHFYTLSLLSLLYSNECCASRKAALCAPAGLNARYRPIKHQTDGFSRSRNFQQNLSIYCNMWTTLQEDSRIESGAPP